MSSCKSLVRYCNPRKLDFTMELPAGSLVDCWWPVGGGFPELRNLVLNFGNFVLECFACWQIDWMRFIIFIYSVMSFKETVKWLFLCFLWNVQFWDCINKRENIHAIHLDFCKWIEYPLGVSAENFILKMCSYCNKRCFLVYMYLDSLIRTTA